MTIMTSGKNEVRHSWYHAGFEGKDAHCFQALVALGCFDKGKSKASVFNRSIACYVWRPMACCS